MKNKVISLLIVLLLLFTVLSACNDPQKSQAVDNNDNKAVVYDLNGEEYILLQTKPSENITAAEGHVLGYLENTILADSALKRINDVETSYN
jgi:hypothetical protein